MVSLEFKFQVLVIVSVVSSSFSQVARNQSTTNEKCGNRFVEKGEDCDCGTEQECKRVGNTCCENCKFAPRGTVCRDAANSCDVPEYCNGKIELCPTDLKIANGISCDKNKGYCHKGECNTHTKKCNELWTGGAVKADNACYEVFNQRGDKKGYCKKLADGKYSACAPKDVYCGRLWCIANGTMTPIYGYIDKVTGTLNSRRILCRSVELPRLPSLPARDTIPDGTKCGNDMVCQNDKCVSLSVAYGGQRTCPNNCNGRGVCNENGNCHCNKGWKCPNCSKPYDGPGGSSDSGLDCSPVPKRPCQCTHGSCCKDCQIVASGTVCRGVFNNSCDVPEYCDGKSEVCPVDLKTMDGLSCKNQKGYCYKGECRTRDEQCDNLWFGGAYAADDICYANFNTDGNINGFCKEIAPTSFLGCTLNNTLCGKLWCIGNSRITVKNWGYGIHWTNATTNNGLFPCKSAVVFQASGKPALGTVLDGTKCGREMVCKDNECVSLSVAYAQQPACANNCNGNGVCNENGNCHCNPGWRCPNCTEAYDGPGGSIDNGLSCQAPITRPTRKIETATTAEQSSDEKIFGKGSILMSVVFLCLLIFLCAGMYWYARHRRPQQNNSEATIHEEPTHEQVDHVLGHENNILDPSLAPDEDSFSWVDNTSLIYETPLEYIRVIDDDSAEPEPQIPEESPLSFAYMTLRDVSMREPPNPYQHLQFSGIGFSQLHMPDGEVPE